MYSRTWWTLALTIAVLLALPGCGTGSQARADSAAGAQSDSSAMGGMSGMSPASGMDSMKAMSGAAIAPAMSAEMTAHMAEMKAADGAKLAAMLPEHRRLVKDMQAHLNAQLAERKMAPMSAWRRLADSIDTDLKAMPKMSAAALAAMMPAHEMRVQSLASVHEAMMRVVR
jgi:hypothetical protein